MRGDLLGGLRGRLWTGGRGFLGFGLGACSVSRLGVVLWGCDDVGRSTVRLVWRGW